MSLVPELILQTVISRGIGTLRSDTRYIYQLFRNMSRGMQDQMKALITSNQVDLNINYPRSLLSVPAIVILLKSEDEHSQGAYLSDFKEIGYPDEFSYDGEIAGEILGGTATVSEVSGQGKIVFGPHYVLSATLNTLSVTNRTFYHSQFTDGTERLTVHIVSGTGAGQQREIIANTASYLMVDSDWTTVPDATSVFEVREPKDEVAGEPSMLYDRRNGNEVIERKGGLYANKYQVQVVGANQEQVIYLYAILKTILTLARTYLEGQGIIDLKMSGTDFVNRPEYLPDFAYMRTMNLDFATPFDVFSPLSNVVENFTFCLIEGIDGTNAQISEDPVDISNPEPEITGP